MRDVMPAEEISETVLAWLDCTAQLKTISPASLHHTCAKCNDEKNVSLWPWPDAW